MKKIKEAIFNKQELKSKINTYISEINSNFTSLLFKLSPLVYKIKLKSTNEILYGMKVISTKNPELVIRFNLSLDFVDHIHSISCWKNHIPINRKYPTPDFTIEGFTENQELKEESVIIDELVTWIRRRNKESFFLNSESIISIDSMAILNMDVEREINEIFNLSKDNVYQKEELSSSIEDIQSTNDSIVLILNDISTQEEQSFVADEIKNQIDLVSGINFFTKNISSDELAISLWLNSKKNNEIIVLDNFNDWNNDEVLSMIDDIITKGEITYQFKDIDLKPSDYPEDGVLDFVAKFIIITSKDKNYLDSKDYTFLKQNSSYEEIYIDENEENMNLKMNEILPNFLPKMTSTFKKDTIRQILRIMEDNTINITIPELALLFEIKLVCKNNWEEYFKEVIQNLPKM